MELVLGTMSPENLNGFSAKRMPRVIDFCIHKIMSIV